MSMERLKYPRTPHLPWSAGVTRDDRIIESLDELCNCFLVATEKLDGSNVCLTRNHVYSRGSNANHPLFNWLKSWHAHNRFAIPEFQFIYAEYCYAVHSILYSPLPHYLHLFAILDGEDSTWLGWNAVERLAGRLDIPTVPYLGNIFSKDEKDLKAAFQNMVTNTKPAYGLVREGFVIRYADQFPLDKFDKKVAKWVRENHVQTNDHWMHQPIVKQALRAKV